MARQKFQLGTVSSGSSLLFVTLLMLGDPFLLLTFCMVVVYAVVPVSIWKKSPSKKWRVATGLTCVIGFGMILLALLSGVLGAELLLGFPAHLVALLAGLAFLPLSVANAVQRICKTPTIE